MADRMVSMSNSIRKTKRFQTVARKRHMTLALPRDGDATTTNTTLPSSEEDMTNNMVAASASASSASSLPSSMQCRENPYSRDGQHVRETIALVTSIVRRIASSSWEYDDTLSSQLERLCVLLSPHDENTVAVGDDSVGGDGGSRSATYCSYDSAMAGIAANSILSQFATTIETVAAMGNSPLLQNQQQYHSQEQHHPQREVNSNNNLAFMFANSLSQILLPSNEDCGTTNNNSIDDIIHNNNHHYRQGIRIKAAIIVNQLAATEPPPPTTTMMESSLVHQEEYSPYGQYSPPPTMLSSQRMITSSSSIPPSWCYVLVHSSALQAIVHHIHPTSRQSFNTSLMQDIDGLQLCEKCVWAVGNLAGDSQLARMALLKEEEDDDIVPKLLGCLKLGLAMTKELRSTNWHQLQSSQQVRAAEEFQTVMGLLRNSIWALINLYRQEETIAPTDILDLQQQQPPPLAPHTEQHSSGTIMSYQRLSPYDIGCLLSLSDESFTTTSTATMMSGRGMQATTWDDIANETCWLLSYLSRLEDDPKSVMEFLCTKWDAFGTTVVSMMVERLAYATDLVSGVLLRRDSTCGTNNNNMDSVPRQMEYLIPCCRTLKNVAMASDRQFCRYIDVILRAKTSTTRSDNPLIDNGIRPFETSVAKLISFGTLGAGNIVSNIASEATSLAGACLYDAGIEPNCEASRARLTLLPALCHAILSPLSTFDFQRELVWALWYTVGFSKEVMDNVVDSHVSMVQHGLVHEFIRIAPPDMGMARALTTILSAMDADATEAAVRLIDLLLRWYDGNSGNISMNDGRGRKLSIIFEEVGLVDALWRICDNDMDESEVAELAAKILDDFYEQDEEEEDEYEANGMSDGQFQFQVSQSSSIPDGGFNFTSM